MNIWDKTTLSCFGFFFTVNVLFYFSAVGSSKNQTGNTLLKYFQFSLLFLTLAAFSLFPVLSFLPSFPVPVAVLPSHGNVNAENTLPPKA